MLKNKSNKVLTFSIQQNKYSKRITSKKCSSKKKLIQYLNIFSHLDNSKCICSCLPIMIIEIFLYQYKFKTINLHSLVEKISVNS
jgi:hypothetical protein